MSAVTAPPPRADWAAEARMSVLFAGLFLGLGAHMAFAQRWFEDWGLSAAEIGAYHVLAVVVRIAAGAALPAAADRWRRPREVVVALAALGLIAALAHVMVETRWALAVLTAALAAAYAGLIPLIDAGAYAAAERRGFSYRRARSVGSFAFLFATFALGALLDVFDAIDLVVIWMAGALALVAAAALAAPLGPAPTEAETEAETAAPGGFWTAARALLFDRSFALFLIAVAAINASHAVLYTYGSVHWSGLGFSDTAIGALWAWGVAAEIGLFFIGRTVMGRLGPARALMLAAGAAAIRWTAMAFDPGLAAAAALQTLHALTFGLMHLAAMEFIARAAPDGMRATAQGLMSATAGGLGMALGAVAAMGAYPVLGGPAYLLGAALGLVGVFAAARLARAWGARS